MKKIFEAIMKDIRLTIRKRAFKKKLKETGFFEPETKEKIKEIKTKMKPEIKEYKQQLELLPKYDIMIEEIKSATETIRNANEDKEEAIKLAVANDQMKQKKIEYLIQIIRNQDNIIKNYHEQIKKAIQEENKNG